MHVFLVLLALWSSPSRTEPFMQKLQMAENEGILATEQRLHLQESAIKSPASMPEFWQKQLQNNPIHPDSATGILVETVQEQMRLGLRSMYNYPTELPYVLDSELFPLRVYYGDERAAALALKVLEAADLSWQKQYVEWGWYPPPIETPEGRYRIYVTSSGMGGGGYMAPLGPNPENDWDDCHSYVVIDQGNGEQSVGATVAHELNHSSQGAMDCLEPVSFWENSATYMMLAVYPGAVWYARYYLQSFQVAPHWSVSDGNQNSAYWYGGFVWPYFLINEFGDDWTDAIWLREIWERSIQNSGYSYNFPHYMGSIDNQLKEAGQGDLNSAFHQFSRARYFIDEYAHPTLSTLPHATQLAPTPAIAGTLILDKNPKTFEPPKASWPKPYGVNYIQLDVPADYDRNTTIEVVTGNEEPWHFQLITIDNNPEIQEWSSTGARTLYSFDPRPGSRKLLIISQLGNEDFHPNFIPGSGTQYTLYVRPTVGLPDITGVRPGSVYDASEVWLTVNGLNFFENATVSFYPDQDFEVKEIVQSTEVQLKVLVRIPRGVMEGKYSLIVTNYDGGSDRFDDAFSVVRNPDAPKSADGCSCSHRGSSPGTFPLFMLLAGLFLVRKRLA